MKNFIFSCFFIVFLSTNIFCLAQGAYVKAGGGYGIGINRGPINSYFQRELLVSQDMTLMEQPMTNIKSIDNNEVQFEIIRESFGTGGKFGIAGGYMFTGHVGAELGLSYFSGGKITSKWNLSGLSDFMTEEKKASMLFIIPSLVVSSDMRGISPYTRAGILVGLMPKIASKFTINDAVNTIILKDELTGGVALGFSAAAGITYPLNGQVLVFAEIAYNGLTYKPTQREITKITANGTEQVITDNYTSAVQPIEDNLPIEYGGQAFDAEKQLTHSYPFGSLGINAGVQYRFIK